MRVVSSHFHTKIGDKESCTAVIKMGKYRVEREVDCYRIAGDVWRITRNDKEVKLN